MGSQSPDFKLSAHLEQKLRLESFKMLWLLLGMVVVVDQTGADYWWMGTQAFGGGEQLGNDLVEVQPGYSAVANEATSSRLIKDQQESDVATNPFIGVAQEPASESICPEGQECRASCPQAKKKIRGYGGIQERIVQRLPCDTGVCCPIPPIPESPDIFSSQSSPEPSNVDSITSSLPITECPATMKCVREDFCDAKGVMVPFRVRLTEQEKKQRGTLIPCMQPSGSFAVCCTAPQEQQEVRDSSLGSATDIQQQLTLEPAQTGETEIVPAEQQLQQQHLGPIGDSCPVLNTLPPLTECEGRKSNCWSPGVRDLDCLDSALCCFDGCANVCLGKGAKLGNGLTAEKREPARTITSSPLLQPLIKSPTKVDLQTQSKAQQQDQRHPQVQVQSKPEYSPQVASNTQSELDAALGDLAKVLVAESRPRPAPIDDRIVYPEPLLANNRFPRRPEPAANPSPSYEELLVLADQKAAQKNAQRPNHVNQPLIKNNPSSSQRPTPGSGYGGRPIVKTPPAQPIASRPTQFVEAIQPPKPQASPQPQSQFQQPSYQAQPRPNSALPSPTQVQDQPSRPSLSSNLPVRQIDNQGAAALPFTQCPSAMKCVEKRLCDFNGVMRDFVTTLSPAQESLRVPLIPCVSQRSSGEVDVCCRDPNYKDPWPEQEQAREESRALGEGDQWRWSKDARNGANAARARSKVASNSQQPRFVENQAPASFATSQLPTRVEGNQPASIFEESVKEVGSSSPRSEEVKKPKRRIAYG